eukprot:gene10422-19124_t
MKTRLGMATRRQDNIWNSKNIQVRIKIKVMHSMIASIALYGCESWTDNKQLEKGLNAFELRCFRRSLGISFKDHRTNISAIEEVTQKAGPYEPLLEIARRRKLQWFGHVTRRSETLAHTIMHGTVEGVLIHYARSKSYNYLPKTVLTAERRLCSSFAAGKIPTSKNTDFETTNDSLQVNWDDGDQSKYPFIFLRDNCQCEHCFHATAMQRTCDVVGKLSVDIKPESTWLSEDGVTMEWEDGHRSSFSFKWLRDRMFPKPEKEIGSMIDCGLKPVTWGSELAEKIPKYEFGKVLTDDTTLLSWLETVAVTGLTLLENTPGTSESLELIRDKLGCVFRPIHYGETDVIQNKPSPNNLAYTADDLPLHVDFPYYKYQPEVSDLV